MTKQEKLKEIGFLIKTKRLKKGITQEKLAELVDISRNTISLIEKGKTCFSCLILIDLAKELDLDLNSIDCIN